MIITEIYALQWARRFEVEVDERITVSELCEHIDIILGIPPDRKDRGGLLICPKIKGALPMRATLRECGAGTGSMFIYVSECEGYVGEVRENAGG